MASCAHWWRAPPQYAGVASEALRALMARLPRLPTTLVGSMVQPEWLIDRQGLSHRAPPRVRAQELWRVAPQWLCCAQDDATQLAIHLQQRLGLDVVGDGEIRRESYSCTFANELVGIDRAHPGSVLDRRNKPSAVPRVVAPVQWQKPVFTHDVAWLRRCYAGPVKMTLPGPFTLSQLSQDEHYGDSRALGLAFAKAVNAEIAFLHAAGVDIVQLDEPYLEARPEAAREFGVELINRALQGIAGVTALHLCFGYGPIDRNVAKPNRYRFLAELEDTVVDIVSVEAAQPRLDLAELRVLPTKTVMLGVLDLGTTRVETVEEICARIAAALDHVAPERLILAPDCGLKYLPPASAEGKLAAMVAAAQRMRLRLDAKSLPLDNARNLGYRFNDH